MKTVVRLKRQRFKDSGSDELEPKSLKRQHLDARDNKGGKGLNKFGSKDEREDIGDIPLLFVASLQKESNRLTDINKEQRASKTLYVYHKWARHIIACMR